MSGLVVDAYLDLGSRYSYLAASQFDYIAIETGATFRWLPIVVQDILEAGNAAVAGTLVSPQYKPAYRTADAQAWADYYAIPFREPRDRITFDPRLLARAAVAAGPQEKRAALMKRLLHAVFVDDRTKIEVVDCIDCAEEVGLERHAFRRALFDPVVEAERLAIGERAKARGVFGAPFFIVGKRSFFGNDRLPLLSHALITMPSDEAMADMILSAARP